MTCHDIRSALQLGTFNIHSANKKLDDVVEIIESRGLHILALQVTWHEDSECVSMKKLRSPGLNDLETATLIPTASSAKKNGVCYVNHGGVVIVSKPGIIVAKIDVKLKLTTFEVLCYRITSGGASFVLVNIYRPVSMLLSDTFFKQFMSLLEWIVTFSLPVTITGDMNVHFKLNDNTNIKKMIDILETFRLTQHISVPTHDRNGYLDVIITDKEHTRVSVSVDDLALSDHFLVTWCANFSPILTYATVRHRKWKNFDINSFVTQLQESELGHAAPPAADLDQFAERYNAIITELLDKLALSMDMRIYEHPRKPWFDQECSITKQHARRLEQKYKSCQNTDTKKAWRKEVKNKVKLHSRPIS